MQNWLGVGQQSPPFGGTVGKIIGGGVDIVTFGGHPFGPLRLFGIWRKEGKDESASLVAKVQALCRVQTVFTEGTGEKGVDVTFTSMFQYWQRSFPMHK